MMIIYGISNAKYVYKTFPNKYPIYLLGKAGKIEWPARSHMTLLFMRHIENSVYKISLKIYIFFLEYNFLNSPRKFWFNEFNIVEKRSTF